MSGQHTPKWVDVVGEVVRTSRYVLKERRTKYATFRRVEEREQTYVILSCGDEIRRPEFNAGGADRKRMRCYRCEVRERDTSVAEATGSGS